MWASDTLAPSNRGLKSVITIFAPESEIFASAAYMTIFRISSKCREITQNRPNLLKKSVRDTLRVALCVGEPHVSPRDIPIKPATFVAKFGQNRPNAVKIMSFSNTFATNVVSSHGMSPELM